VSDADGRLEIYLLGEDANLYHAWQGASGGDFGPWTGLAGPWSPDADPVVTRNADGRLEVFVWGQDRALYHLWQGAPGGAYGLPQAFSGG